jgi:hypothetical protein
MLSNNKINEIDSDILMNKRFRFESEEEQRNILITTEDESDNGKSFSENDHSQKSKP